MTAMPAARAAGGAVQRHLAPVHEHLAAVGLMDPGQDLHQRRLARAVLAEQRVHLAAAQRHRPVDQGLDRAEGLLPRAAVQAREVAPTASA